MTCGAGLCCISKSVGGWTRTSKCLAKYLGAFRQAGSLDPQSQIDLSFVWIWHQGWASGYFHAAQSAKLGGDFLGEIHLILKFSQNFNEGWDDFYEFRMWGEWDSFWTIAEEWACSLGRSDKNKWNKCWRWDRHSKTLWVVRRYTSILFPLPLPRKDFTRLADRLEPGALLLFADLHYEISLPMAQMARFSKLPWEMATKVEVVGEKDTLQVGGSASRSCVAPQGELQLPELPNCFKWCAPHWLSTVLWIHQELVYVQGGVAGRAFKQSSLRYGCLEAWLWLRFLWRNFEDACWM